MLLATCAKQGRRTGLEESKKPGAEKGGAYRTSGLRTRSGDLHGAQQRQNTSATRSIIRGAGAPGGACGPCRRAPRRSFDLNHRTVLSVASPPGLSSPIAILDPTHEHRASARPRGRRRKQGCLLKARRESAETTSGRSRCAPAAWPPPLCDIASVGRRANAHTRALLADVRRPHRRARRA